MTDFHARALANIAKIASERGESAKATALYRTILHFRPLSSAANEALGYLMSGGHLPPRRAAG